MDLNVQFWQLSPAKEMKGGSTTIQKGANMRFFCVACVFGIFVAAAIFLIDFRNASPDAHAVEKIATPIVVDPAPAGLTNSGSPTDGRPTNALQITSTGN